MTTKDQAEKEYRAQWIRDAARDFMIAHLSVGAEQPVASQLFTEPLQNVSARLHALASSLWDRYVEERG